MDESRGKRWVRAVIVIGVVYCLVGVVFGAPTHHVRVWRLAAWVVSGLAYATHVGYEHFRLRSSPRLGSLHVAMAVGLGAFGLAAAAIVHSLSVESTIQHRRLLLFALVIWPVMTALPAFLGSLAASWVLTRLPQGARAR